MTRSGACLASILVALTLTTIVGCSDKQPAPAAQSQPPATTTTTSSAAPVTAEKQAAAEPGGPSAPAENISETDDGGQETVSDAPASTTQPSVRLGPAATTQPTSSAFKEGTNYARVIPAQPTNAGPGKIEVIEVFWYGCGHCFALDPAIESWRNKSKPAYVEFVRVPAMWNDATRFHARVFYTAEALGKLDEMHSDIFRAIHVNGNPLNTAEKVADLFVTHGVSADQFQQAFSSFAVENKLQRADFLNRRYRITSVPTLLVQGKYRTDLGMAGSEDQLFTLINELAASEHGG